MLYVYWVENDDLKICNSNFVMLYVYWEENDDLKIIAWREQDLNAKDSIKKKVWLGNQMMLFVILLEIFNLLVLFNPLAGSPHLFETLLKVS